MDSHVSMQVRRAKRAKSKDLDLSCLGLVKLKTDVFTLIDLESLKLNDNSLVDVPSEIHDLVNLTALDLSNNKLENLPEIDFEKLQNLCSIRLESNPASASLAPHVLKQLAQPDKVAGKTQVQVIRELLSQALKQGPGSDAPASQHIISSGDASSVATPARNAIAGSAPPAPPPVPTPFAPAAPPAPPKEESPKDLADYLKSLGGSDDEYSDDFHEDDATKTRAAAGGIAKPEPVPTGGTSVQAFSMPADADSDNEAKPPSAPPLARRRTPATETPAHPPKASNLIANAEKAELKPLQPVASASTSLGGNMAANILPPKESKRGKTRNVGIQVNRDKKKKESEPSEAESEVLRLRAQVAELQGNVNTGAELEVKKLRVQVCELKEQLESEKPAESSSKLSFASTMPSRLHTSDESDDAGKFKQQMQEEQRKAKRLEREVQKLQERARENSGSSGTSSAPHVELSEIQEGEILSKSGGFSIIYKGTWHGTPVAIKKLFDASNSPESLAEMDCEVDKLSKLRHPNIISLLAVHRKPPVFNIVLEVITGGSLHQLLHGRQTFGFAPGLTPEKVTPQDFIRIDASMALALAFMHARNVAHRDVKSPNVLVSPHLEAKLCDFGLARMKSELMTGAMQYAGTPQYMAPELLRQQKYTEKVDVWAFGTLVWETMAEDIPFANLEVPEIRELSVSGKMLPMPVTAPRGIQAAIKSCWTLDDPKRPTMADMSAQFSTFRDQLRPTEDE